MLWYFKLHIRNNKKNKIITIRINVNPGREVIKVNINFNPAKVQLTKRIIDTLVYAVIILASLNVFEMFSNFCYFWILHCYNGNLYCSTLKIFCNLGILVFL